VRPEEEHAMTTLSAPNPAKTETTQFTIGAKVVCRSGHCGKLTRVIIDPISRTLTHLVVEPRNESLGRLVPLHLVEASTGEQIDLGCTLKEFDALDPSQDTDYFPMDDYYGSYYGGYARGYGYGGSASFWPYYGFGGLGYGWGWGPQATTYEAIPRGEVTIRRGDPVHATDGDVGRVAGLVIGTPTGEVTHVLLQEGHLWGKKDVAIPIRSVERVADVVNVALSKQELADLPSIDIDHPEAHQRAS
jgi:sporulation protein YlmC with PRC-barrel domain